MIKADKNNVKQLEKLGSLKSKWTVKHAYKFHLLVKEIKKKNFHCFSQGKITEHIVTHINIPFRKGWK